jgi:hypothetical protein
MISIQTQPDEEENEDDKISEIKEGEIFEPIKEEKPNV